MENATWVAVARPSPYDTGCMFGCELGIDAISASFIRDGGAVDEIRKICVEMGTPQVYIFSKIESALGVKNFDNILDHSDGIM